MGCDHFITCNVKGFLTALTVSGILLLSVAPPSSASTLLQRAGSSGDSDADGIVDVIDDDDDNDTISDVNEGTGDTDGDGIADCLDLDSDNDGIPDLVEAISARDVLERIDVNADGVLDASVSVGANGMADTIETAIDSGESITGFNDADGDNIFDQLDLDSDNDGLPDIIEAGSVDADRDGRLDNFRDLNGDGLDDQLGLFPIAIRDTDSDGVFDFRDIDSDQDGLRDRLESAGADVDSDGRVDFFIDADSDGLTDDYPRQPAPVDSDGDRIADYLDSDPILQQETPTLTGDQTDSEQGLDPPVDPAAETGDESSESSTGFTLTTGRQGSVFGGCSIAEYQANKAQVFAPTKQRRWLDPALPILIVLATVGLLRRRLGAAQRVLLALSVVCFNTGCAPLAQRTIYSGLGIGFSQLDVDSGRSPLQVDEPQSVAAAADSGV